MVKRGVAEIETEVIGDDGSRSIVEKKKVMRKKKMTAAEREELLIENFVGVQHAMTNLSIKFGILSDNITKLLQVFEEAARGFVSGGRVDDKDMLRKIDSLLEQNKTIAKGLVLMEGKLRSRADVPQDGGGRTQGVGGRWEVLGNAPPVRPRPLPSS